MLISLIKAKYQQALGFAFAPVSKNRILLATNKPSYLLETPSCCCGPKSSLVRMGGGCQSKLTERGREQQLWFSPQGLGLVGLGKGVVVGKESHVPHSI